MEAGDDGLVAYARGDGRDDGRLVLLSHDCAVHVSFMPSEGCGVEWSAEDFLHDMMG